MNKARNQSYSSIRWIMLSQILLALYLAFFHTTLEKSPTEILYTGLLFSAATTAIIVLCRNVFYNRFEYWIHHAIGLDMFLEGFVPYHETLGFYYCALAFWTVFWGYHGLLIYQSKAKASAVTENELQTGVN